MRINAGAMVIAWLCAFSIVAALAMTAIRLGEQRLDARLATSDTVFLGTSLMYFALHDHRNGQPFAPIGARKAIRIGLATGRESEVLAVARAAAISGVATVFIEINPIIARFAGQQSGCNAWTSFTDQLLGLRRIAIAVIRGGDVGLVWGSMAEQRNDAPQSIDYGRIEGMFPLKFDEPCYMTAWQELFLGSPNTKFVMVAMPRDKVGRELVGARGMQTFAEAAHSFSSRFGLLLFEVDPAGTWSSELFLDQAHMNQRGSERFVKEIAEWWSKNK